jgi:periplasmic divalent cation tolerance protein
MTNAVVGLVMCSSRSEARAVAQSILKRKLAACVNIVGGLESHYWWQGKIQLAREYLLLIKTTRARARAVANAVKRTHSYEVPEVIFLPVAAGETKYLQWLRKPVKTND